MSPKEEKNPSTDNERETIPISEQDQGHEVGAVVELETPTVSSPAQEAEPSFASHLPESEEQEAKPSSNGSNSIPESEEEAKANPPPTQWAAILEKLELLAQEFEAKLRYDRQKETIIDRLHEELQAYKNDQIGQALRPLIMDIILYLDNHAKWVAGLYKKQAQGTLEVDKLLTNLAEQTEEWQDMLYRQSVEVFKEEDAAFNPKTQRVNKAVTTDDPGLDRTVAERVKLGYTWQHKLLRPEYVNVYKHTPKPDKA